MIVQFGGMSTTWMWVSITGWLVRRSAPLCFSQSWRSVRAINHPGNPSYGGYVDQWFRTWVFQSTPTENRLMDLPLWKSHSNHMEISSYGDLIYIYIHDVCIYIYVMYIMGIHWIYVLGPCSTFEYVVSIHFRSLKWARFYQPLKIGWFPSRCPIQGRLVDSFPYYYSYNNPQEGPRYHWERRLLPLRPGMSQAIADQRQREQVHRGQSLRTWGNPNFHGLVMWFFMAFHGKSGGKSPTNGDFMAENPSWNGDLMGLMNRSLWIGGLKTTCHHRKRLKSMDVHPPKNARANGIDP